MELRSLEPSPPSRAHWALRVLLEQRGVAEHDRLDLALLWSELRTQRLRILESFSTRERCFLVLTQQVRHAAPLRERDLLALEQFLLGKPQKCIGYELGVAPSTTALAISRALDALGKCVKPAAVSMILVMAASQHRGLISMPDAWLTTIGETQVVSVEHPRALLVGRLSAAEFAVASALLDGASYEEIAFQRSVATRTVANQLSSVFRRLDISGRMDLIHYTLRAVAGRRRRVIGIPSAAVHAAVPSASLPL